MRRGLARSRTEAQQLIAAGGVTVAGAPAGKAATMVRPDEPVAVIQPRRWASRGGDKLAGALRLLEVDLSGRHCLDAGASTGGFTDVLLASGAARVVAVDVGYGQLDWRLRTDARVVVLDRTNVRHLRPEEVSPPPVDLVTADLSFISLTAVLPALRSVATEDADFLLLVKPQFEVGPGRVGKGGVVREPEAWKDALHAVAHAGAELGLSAVAVMPSPLPGSAGNVEFFLHLRAGSSPQDLNELLGQAVAEASSAADPEHRPGDQPAKRPPGGEPAGKDQTDGARLTGDG